MNYMMLVTMVIVAAGLTI